MEQREEKEAETEKIKGDSFMRLYLRKLSPYQPILSFKVGGWTQVYKGLTFVTVRGAGHEVPLHRPKQALTLIKSFLAGSPMPTLTELTELHSDS